MTPLYPDRWPTILDCVVGVWPNHTAREANVCGAWNPITCGKVHILRRTATVRDSSWKKYLSQFDNTIELK